MRREFAIYISSTLEDLEEERRIAADVVGAIGTRKHSYRASEEGVVQTCVADVRACDLYIGILGQRYGYVPEGEDNPDSKSITEIEFDACENPGDGRARIPRLIFIKPTDHSPGIPTKHIDAFSRPKTAARMEAFLARANGPTEVAFQFKSASELRTELTLRVNEKAAAFHSGGANPQGILGGKRHWRTRLVPIAIAGTPGSDDALLQALKTYGGDRLRVFELSPESAAYVAEADRRPGASPRDPDRGFATAQLGGLLIGPASLPRLLAVSRKIEAMIDVQVAASGRFIVVCAGVDPAHLPAAWQRATVVSIDAATVNGLPQAFAKEVDDRVSATGADLSSGVPLALPYLILAPDHKRVSHMCDPATTSFEAFDDEEVREKRRAQFDTIAGAAKGAITGWPAGAYGDQPEEWRCFAPAAGSADELVRRAIDRVNAASFASRERRLLQDATVVPRRYRLADYLSDRFGSRRLIADLRLSGCLFVVDELALLNPALRDAAHELLDGNRSAVASITPFDPARSPTRTLLGEFSYLRVGNVINRFRTDHDPRCEVALNSIERFERWLRFVIPELVVANDVQEVQPELAAEAHLVLRGSKA
jgi:hypothetical protein